MGTNSNREGKKREKKRQSDMKIEIEICERRASET